MRENKIGAKAGVLAARKYRDEQRELARKNRERRAILGLVRYFTAR